MCASDGEQSAADPGQRRCTWRGYIYDPSKGDPDHGIAPGTPFEALPESWVCPDCRAPKRDFEPVSEGNDR